MIVSIPGLLLALSARREFITINENRYFKLIISIPFVAMGIEMLIETFLYPPFDLGNTIELMESIPGLLLALSTIKEFKTINENKNIFNQNRHEDNKQSVNQLPQEASLRFDVKSFINTKTTLIVILSVCLVATVGAMLYFTTNGDVERYAQKNAANELYDIIVNTNSYHFYPNDGEVELLALQRLHNIDRLKFRDAGYKIMHQNSGLNYSDVLACSDLSDCEYIANLYMKDSATITAKGYSHYKPFVATVDEIKKKDPQSNTLIAIRSIYRTKNIEKAKADINSCLNSISDIDSYISNQEKLKNYGLKFSDMHVNEYQNMVSESGGENSKLDELQTEKNQTKDPTELDKQIEILIGDIESDQIYYLSGYIISQIALNEYEILVKAVVPSSRSGEIGQHAILKTYSTSFTSQGNFYNLAVGASGTTRTVQTTSGFTQAWHIYNERTESDIQAVAKDKQNYQICLAVAQSQKHEAENNLSLIQPRITALEQSISNLDKEKATLESNWQTSFNQQKSQIEANLEKIATDYVDANINFQTLL